MAQSPIPAEADAGGTPAAPGAEAQGGAAGGGQLSQALSMAHKGLSAAAELLAATKSPMAEQAAELKGALEQLVDGGGDAPQAAPGGAGGMAPAEAGAGQVRQAL